MKDLMPLYVISFLFLVAAHYIRWDEWTTLKLPHPIRILFNYVLGTVGMLGPFIWWLSLRGEWEVIWTLCGFVVAAGLAPALSYANDTVAHWRRDARESKEREKLLEGQRHAEKSRV